MRKILDIFLVVMLMGLTMLSLYLYSERLNLESDISIKEGQILKLIKINRVNSGIISSQDSIASLKDSAIANLKMQLKILGKLPMQVNYTGFSLGEKTISATELLTLFNKVYKENETNKQTLQILNKQFGVTYSSDDRTITTSYDSTSVISKLEISEKEKIKTIRDLEKKNDELEIKAIALGLIQKRYNIPYILEGSTIRIPDNKIDTLIDVYPLIKNRIKYDKNKKQVWIRGLIL